MSRPTTQLFKRCLQQQKPSFQLAPSFRLPVGLTRVSAFHPYTPFAGPSRLRAFTTSLSAHDAVTPSEQMKITPRMRIQFTCAAVVRDPTEPAPVAEADGVKYMSEGDNGHCGHRNEHEFTKQAFEKGIVLVQCPECKNRHLIADHLQWFTNNPTADDPNFKDDNKTIIDLMKAKGEMVRRGKVAPGQGEVVEVYE